MLSPLPSSRIPAPPVLAIPSPTSSQDAPGNDTGRLRRNGEHRRVRVPAWRPTCLSPLEFLFGRDSGNSIPYRPSHCRNQHLIFGGVPMSVRFVAAALALAAFAGATHGRGAIADRARRLDRWRYRHRLRTRELRSVHERSQRGTLGLPLGRSRRRARSPRRRRALGLVRHYRRCEPAPRPLRRLAVVESESHRALVPQGRHRTAELSRRDRQRKRRPAQRQRRRASVRRRLRRPRRAEALVHPVREFDRLQPAAI